MVPCRLHEPNRLRGLDWTNQILRGMSGTGPYDPRSIGNLLLEIADQQQRPLTNLELQKLLYFAHAIFLIETGDPLILGCFEAWQYGPVHPIVYKAFQESRDKPIRSRASRVDVLTGMKSPLPPPASPPIRELCLRIMAQYGRMTAGRLVDISHAKNAPWHYIVNKAKTSLALGLRIPDNVIIERFRYHKVSVGAKPTYGEPSEDTPLA
jgi:uncharacterized phage-associated protein